MDSFKLLTLTNALVAVTVVVALRYIFRSKASKYHVQPRISTKAKAINTLLKPFQYFQIGPFQPLSLASLKEQASAATKTKSKTTPCLTDFGKELSYEAKYEQTMDIINNSDYSPIGYLSARDFFTRRLISKLRFCDALKFGEKQQLSHPCLEQKLNPPIFVIGLPRTGTTYLHRLLSIDPDNRSPLTYELFDPVPRKNGMLPTCKEEQASVRCTEKNYNDDKKARINFLSKSIEILTTTIPHFPKIHAVGAELPEECMMSISSDIPMLFSTFHLLIRHWETSFAWSGVEAYSAYRRVLLFLQWIEDTRVSGDENENGNDNDNTRKQPKRWTLKCPIHLGLLPSLTHPSAFPEATLIWTHRRSNQSIGSLCSFVNATQDMHDGCKDGIDLKALGNDVLNFGETFLKRAMDFFDSENGDGEGGRVNVMYEDLISDPIAVIKSVYETLGYEYTNEYNTLLVEYINEDKTKRESSKSKSSEDGNDKIHSYDLKDYGLTDEQVLEQLKWYDDKFFTEAT